jgi:hypothetical protein
MIKLSVIYSLHSPKCPSRSLISSSLTIFWDTTEDIFNTTAIFVLHYASAVWTFYSQAYHCPGIIRLNNDEADFYTVPKSQDVNLSHGWNLSYRYVGTLTTRPINETDYLVCIPNYTLLPIECTIGHWSEIVHLNSAIWDAPLVFAC